MYSVTSLLYKKLYFALGSTKSKRLSLVFLGCLVFFSSPSFVGQELKTNIALDIFDSLSN